MNNTPLRYPGGKSKIYNRIVSILEKNFDHTNITYVELFAGGAGVALKLLYHKKVKIIHLNDADYSIYILWKMILEKNKELKEKIQNAVFTIEEWNKQKNIFEQFKKNKIVNDLDLAYSVLYLNRCNYSGIITGGVMGGLQQNGTYKMNARFNQKKLCNQLSWIYQQRKNIKITNEDAKVILQQLHNRNMFVYLDPPYVLNGKRLYFKYFQEIDHILLQQAVSKLNCKWIMTYDNVDVIKQLYSDFYQSDLDIQYTMNTKKKITEIMIYSNNTIV